MPLLKISFFTFQLLVNILSKKYDWKRINYVIEEYGWLIFPLGMFVALYLYIHFFDVPASVRYYIGDTGKRCGNAELGYSMFHYIFYPLLTLALQIVCDFLRNRMKPILLQ